MDALLNLPSDSVSRFLIALGEPIRQEIIRTLANERLNVGDLAKRFPISRPAMSHHLKILGDAGILIRERHGRERIYRVHAERCRELADELKSFVNNCCNDKNCC